MKYYAIFRVHSFDGIHDKLYVFDSKADRDRFLVTGEMYSYELIYPWETFPIKASEAKKHAHIDSYGDRYACCYFGGVEYVWGQDGYERFWNERNEVTVCQHTS